MISFHSIKVGLTALGLLISLSPAVAKLVPENETHDRRCYPTYNVTGYKLDVREAAPYSLKYYYTNAQCCVV